MIARYWSVRVRDNIFPKAERVNKAFDSLFLPELRKNCTAIYVSTQQLSTYKHPLAYVGNTFVSRTQLICHTSRDPGACTA